MVQIRNVVRKLPDKHKVKGKKLRFTNRIWNGLLDYFTEAHLGFEDGGHLKKRRRLGKRFGA